MRRWLALVTLLALPAFAAEEEPAWALGTFASGTWASGTWDGNTVAVPNVVGEADSTAAEMVLNAAGLVLGNVLARCSDAAADEVVGQDPAPGTPVAAMTAVDVLVSNGIECASGRPGVRLRGLSIGL